ncbi:MAG: Arm DNA-binding domain-containing protein [Candidatus Nitrotoga sp.]
MTLVAHTNGGKYWRVDFYFGSKPKALALGVYPDVTITDAKQR